MLKKFKLLKSRANRNSNDTCKVAQVVLHHILAEGIHLVNLVKNKIKAEVPLEELHKNDT